MFRFFRRLSRLERHVAKQGEENHAIYKRMQEMAGELEELRSTVEANGQLIGSAVSLIGGLADKLEAALKQAQDEEDDAPIHDLVAELRAQQEPLAAALAKNTPAAPPVQAPEGSPPADSAVGTDPGTGNLPSTATQS